MTVTLNEEQTAALIRFVERHGHECMKDRKLLWVPAGKRISYWKLPPGTLTTK